MGVHGLWQLLQPAGRPVSLESLEGKVLAVDVSIWLHQTMKGMRDKDGNPLPNAHIQGLFTRICKLLYYSIKPVFVFDGGVPFLKKQTMAERRERKEKAEKESSDIVQKLLKNLVQSNAVKLALTGSTQSNRRVPGVQGRNQEKDIFELAPLPESEEIGLSMITDEWEREFELQEQWIKDGLASLSDAHPDSEEFRSLPMEIQHEILAELKEKNKYHTLSKLTQMPEDSDSFSSYQLKKLMKQSRLTTRIDEVRKEMSSKVPTDLKYSLGDDYYGDDVESRRIVSEDAAHYVLIKGLSKRKQEEEAEKYELQNRVKVEKIDDTDSKYGDNGLTKSSFCQDKQPEMMSTSSDSDSGIEAVVFRRYKGQHRKRSKMKTSISGNKKKKQDHRFLAGRKSGQDNDYLSTVKSETNSSQHLPEEISSSEEFIEVTVNPNAPVVDDELFPASIFQTSLEVTDKEKNTPENQQSIVGIVPGNSNSSSQDGKVAAKSSIGNDDIVNEDIANNDNSQDVNLPIICPTENIGNPLKNIAIGNNEDIIAKRKKILDEISKQLALKKESLAVSLIDVDENMSVKSHEGDKDETLIEDYSNGGGFFQETGDIVQENDLQSESKESCEDNNGIVVLTDKTKSSMETIYPSSDSEDLSLAIELSIQEARLKNQEHNSMSSLNQDIAVEHDQKLAADTEPPSEKILVQKSDAEEMKEGEKNTRSKTTSVSSLKSVNRLQPEDYDEDETVNDNYFAVNETELLGMNSYLDSERQSLMYEQGKQNRLATSVTEQINQDAQELLRLFGIPYVVSPMEAEAQCAFLDLTEQTQGTITDDSDIWLFGGRRMYKNFFNQSKFVEMYCLENIHNHFGLSRDQLINIALLCGSDYTEGIQGVGPVRALEIMAEFPGDGLEGLHAFSNKKSKNKEASFMKARVARKWWDKARKKLTCSENKLRNRLKDLKLLPGFPSEAVVVAYLNPTVDESQERFTWRSPDIDLLREYTKFKFGWSREKTDQHLLPMIKQLNKKDHQKRISAYFQPEHFIQASKVKSQRLKKALQLFKNPPGSTESNVETDERAQDEDETNNATAMLARTSETGKVDSYPQKKHQQNVQSRSKKNSKKKSKKNYTQLMPDDEAVKNKSNSSKQTDCLADDFMTSMRQRVSLANSELENKGKSNMEVKLLNCKVEPIPANLNVPLKDSHHSFGTGSKIMSLETMKPGRKIQDKKRMIKTVCHLSESSSSESEPSSHGVKPKNKKTLQTEGNLQNIVLTKTSKILSGRNASKEVSRTKKSQKSQENPKQQHKTSENSNVEKPQPSESAKDHVRTKTLLPAALAESTFHISGLESSMAMADVSVINKQNLPETLAYLTHRSRQDRLILHRMKGDSGLNAVEKRLHDNEKKSQSEKLSISSTASEALTFENILGNLDEVERVKRSAKNKSLPKSHNKSKERENHQLTSQGLDLQGISENSKDSLTISKKRNKNQNKVGFGSSDESFDAMNLSSPISKKSEKAKQFDLPISQPLYKDCATKKRKESKFSQQMKHLNDPRSVRGHGPMPRLGLNEFVMDRASVGKGKGQGKNRPWYPDAGTSTNRLKPDKTDVEDLTEVDLGSDFSDCD